MLYNIFGLIIYYRYISKENMDRLYIALQSLIFSSFLMLLSLKLDSFITSPSYTYSIIFIPLYLNFVLFCVKRFLVMRSWQRRRGMETQQIFKRQEKMYKIDLIISFLCTVLVSSFLFLVANKSTRSKEWRWEDALLIFSPLLLALLTSFIWLLCRKRYTSSSAHEVQEENRLELTNDAPISQSSSVDLENQPQNSFRIDTQDSLNLLITLHALLREQENPSERSSRVLEWLQQLQQQYGERNYGVSTEFLSHLPTFKFDEKNFSKNVETTCPICLCDYVNDDILRTL
jgi:hypothetical protein